MFLDLRYQNFIPCILC